MIPVAKHKFSVLLKVAQSRPDTARNSSVERSERNKSHTNYMLSTFILSRTRQTWKNEKNNVTSHYAKTYITINCKKKTALHRNNIITSLVPVWH